MHKEYDIFPKSSRSKLSVKANRYMTLNNVTREDAAKHVMCFYKKYGLSSPRQALKKERMQTIRNSNALLKGLSYDSLEHEYEKSLQRKKMNKYYAKNRIYQRLSTRIHTFKVNGNMDLVEKLKKERDSYRLMAKENSAK